MLREVSKLACKQRQMWRQRGGASNRNHGVYGICGEWRHLAYFCALRKSACDVKGERHVKTAKIELKARAKNIGVGHREK
jgi:hypothetical protein